MKQNDKVYFFYIYTVYNIIYIYILKYISLVVLLKKKEEEEKKERRRRTNPTSPHPLSLRKKESKERKEKREERKKELKRKKERPTFILDPILECHT
jgi:hypothetical protein